MNDATPSTSLLRERRPHGHARVTYVELFFDLIFVFVITQLSHGLAHHLDLHTAVQMLVLFAMAMLALVGREMSVLALGTAAAATLVVVAGWEHISLGRAREA